MLEIAFNFFQEKIVFFGGGEDETLGEACPPPPVDRTLTTQLHAHDLLLRTLNPHTSTQSLV